MPPAIKVDVAANLVLEAEKFRRDLDQLKIDVASDPRLASMPRRAIEDYLDKYYKFKPGGAGGGGSGGKSGVFGGIADIAAAGGVAGIAASLTLKLIDAIEGMIKQSKIVQTVQENLNKAMGLLIDLILLPFLPIITWALIRLFTEIMHFGKSWSDGWKVIDEKGLVGLIKLKLESIIGDFPKWLQGFIDWLFSDKSTGEKVVDVIMGLKTLMGGFFAYLGEIVMARLIDFLFGKGTYESDKEIVLKFAGNLVNDIIKNLYNLWFFGGQIFFEFRDKFVAPIIEWLYGMWWNGGNIFWQFYDTWVSPIIQFLYDVWYAGGKIFFQIMAGEVPHLAEGGYIEKTGIAVVHKGETVVPAGGGTGGITVNIYGTYQNDEDLYKKFIDKLRRDQWRQNV
jgi:hypothetical protein